MRSNRLLAPLVLASLVAAAAAAPEASAQIARRDIAFDSPAAAETWAAGTRRTIE